MKVKRFYFILLISFLSFMLLESSGTNISTERVAKVKMVKGKVFWHIKGEKKRKRLSINKVLPLNSIIETGKSSKVVLLLKGGSKVELDENSSIILNRSYLKKVHQSTSVIKGSVKFKIKKIFKDKKFRVYTPTAVVGVRGTEYEIQIAPDGSIAVNVEEGIVEVETEKETAKLSKNQSCESSIERSTILVKKELKDMDEWKNRKEQEINRDPIGKVGTIKERLARTEEKQEKLYDKISKNNRQAADEVENFQFNQCRSEGLFEAAKWIVRKHSRNKKVRKEFETVKKIHSRLERLNRLIEEKFAKLDKLYERRSGEMDKQFKEKEKKIEESFKDKESELKE